MKPRKPKTEKNDSTKAGAFASKKVIFGSHNRYAIAAVHTRFNNIEWFVYDVESLDFLMDTAEVIRQELSFEKAIAGLTEE